MVTCLDQLGSVITPEVSLVHMNLYFVMFADAFEQHVFITMQVPIPC